MEILPVSEIDLYMKLLVYGPTGVGKTTLAGTLDPPGTLFVNIEGGMLSVADTAAQATKQLRNVGEVEEVMNALAQKSDEFAWVTTVVVDSATELQTLSLEGLVGAAKKKDRSRNIDVVNLQDYGHSTTQLKRVLRGFRDMERHVIFTALSKDVIKRGSDPPRLEAVVPTLTSKLSASLMGYMDFVWYMDVAVDGSRGVITKDTFPYKAKTRGHRFSKAIGPYVTDPNLATLYATLQETEK